MMEYEIDLPSVSVALQALLQPPTGEIIILLDPQSKLLSLSRKGGNCHDVPLGDPAIVDRHSLAAPFNNSYVDPTSIYAVLNMVRQATLAKVTYPKGKCLLGDYARCSEDIQVTEEQINTVA